MIFVSIVLIDQLPPLSVSYFNHLESWDTVLFQTPDSSTAFLSLSPVLTNPRFTFTWLINCSWSNLFQTKSLVSSARPCLSFFGGFCLFGFFPFPSPWRDYLSFCFGEQVREGITALSCFVFLYHVGNLVSLFLFPTCSDLIGGEQLFAAKVNAQDKLCHGAGEHSVDGHCCW